jgi:glycine cleavage system H protein
MSERRYTASHEWLELEDHDALVGITDFAQRRLGDVVFLELPLPGVHLHQGDEAATIETVQNTGIVIMPVDGTILEVNTDVEEDPVLVNESPERRGWLFRVRIANADEARSLLDAGQYQALLEGPGEYGEPARNR